jgi:restriction system protein
MSKRTELRRLGKRRQATRWDRFGCIHDYHAGAYECDHVSPYTKSAGNIDAQVFVMLQDWASDSMLGGPPDPLTARLGHMPHLRTNKTLKILLSEVFSLTLADVYVTNLFPFVKAGKMSAKIRMEDLKRAAREFALPQVQIVKPQLVICLGLATFNAVRAACGESQRRPLEYAIRSSFAFEYSTIWCQAHLAARGRSVRQHVADWRRMMNEVSAGTRMTRNA